MQEWFLICMHKTMAKTFFEHPELTFPIVFDCITALTAHIHTSFAAIAESSSLVSTGHHLSDFVVLPGDPSISHESS